MNAANMDKLEEEGTWSHQQIILGFAVDVESLAITRPEEKLPAQEFPYRGACPLSEPGR